MSAEWWRRGVQVLSWAAWEMVVVGSCSSCLLMVLRSIVDEDRMRTGDVIDEVDCGGEKRAKKRKVADEKEESVADGT